MVKNVTKQKSVHTYRKNQWGGHRIVPSKSAPHSHLSLPPPVPRTFRTPGLPTSPPPGLVLAPGKREASLTVRPELKLQEFVAEFALVTHIVTQIEITLHSWQKATNTKL